MEIFKLFGTIALNNQEANQGIEETTGKASQAQGKIVESFKKIGAAVITFFATDKIVDFGMACIDAASDAQAMSSQFTQTFGELESQAQKSLSGIADATGIAENRMKGSYTKIAAFAKTSGMETEDALSLTERAMKAVADSAAFYDRSLEDTTESLQSFLKGNYENDAALGLSATETTRNAAANKLYGKSFIELSEAQKQLTLLQMVEDANALSGAMGQAERESATWTNQTGNLKQAWKDFKAVIGQNFLQPAIQGVMKITEVIQLCSNKVPVLVAWFQDVYNKASEYFPAIQQTFQEIWMAAQYIWTAVGQPVFDMIMSMIGTVKELFAQYMPEIREFVSQCFDDIKQLWEMHLKPCFDAIGAFIENVLAPTFESVFNGFIAPAVETAFNFITSLWNDTLKPVFTGIIDFITGVFTLNWEKAWNGVKDVLRGILNGIISGIENMINGAISALNGLIEGINKVVEKAGKKLGLNVSIPTIGLVSLPRLEEGGILEKGQVGLLEGRGAEAVVPLDQNRAWISAVAKDMEGAIGGTGAVSVLNQILSVLTDLDDTMTEKMIDALATMKFDVNNREFARLVKAVN